jgi:hypothetical protein
MMQFSVRIPNREPLAQQLDGSLTLRQVRAELSKLESFDFDESMYFKLPIGIVDHANEGDFTLDDALDKARLLRIVRRTNPESHAHEIVMKLKLANGLLFHPRKGLQPASQRTFGIENCRISLHRESRSDVITCTAQELAMTSTFSKLDGLPW